MDTRAAAGSWLGQLCSVADVSSQPVLSSRSAEELVALGTRGTEPRAWGVASVSVVTTCKTQRTDMCVVPICKQHKTHSRTWILAWAVCVVCPQGWGL